MSRLEEDVRQLVFNLIVRTCAVGTLLSMRPCKKQCASVKGHSLPAHDFIALGELMEAYDNLLQKQAECFSYLFFLFLKHTLQLLFLPQGVRNLLL